MNEKKRVLIATAIIVSAIALFIIALHMEQMKDSSLFWGAKVLTQQEFAEYQTVECESALSKGILLYNNQLLPYDIKKNCYYFPHDLENISQQGDIYCDSGSVCIKQDPYMQDISQAIAEGHTFEVVVLKNGQCIQSGKLVFTGLPMVNWTLDSPVDWEKVDGGVTELFFSGTVTVFDPNGQNYQVTQSRMNGQIRGNASRLNDKKSFKMSLCHNDGSGYSISLCGLRKDNNWILNGLGGDESCLREKTAWQLWEQVCKTNSEDIVGSRMVYVELVADGHYLGVYGLQEPIDKKQLLLGEKQILYKSDGHFLPTPEQIDNIQYVLKNETNLPIDEEGNYCWNVDDVQFAANENYIHIGLHTVKMAVRYAAVDIKDIWEPMRSLSQVMNNDDSTIMQVESLVDLENLADIAIFRQVLLNYDGRTRNMYYLADVLEGKITYIPWDMDAVFGAGRQYFRGTPTVEQAATIIMGRDRFYDDPYQDETELPACAEKQLGYDWLAERWRVLGTGPLSAENISEILSENYHKLVVSGAFARNDEKWKGCFDNEESFEDLLAFVRIRGEIMEDYYSDPDRAFIDRESEW